jgi:C-terminal processing protease CtpA/Prc
MTVIHETPELIEALIERLTASYVFPERSARAAELLRRRLDRRAYPPRLGPELCELVSADLLEASGDRHLRLLWHDDVEASRDEAELVAALREQIRLENHGVRRVELLPENIGLIELTIIPEASTGGATLAAAMHLVQHTDALILDLRATRGGSPDGVVVLASYLFPDGDVRLSDFVEGPSGPTRQYWTSAFLPGTRYLDRPVFVLTSTTTFSGGEALAYDLQALGRATVVGETTRGGAHPSEVVSLTEHVELRLPVARAVNPVTDSNWEGVGVQPDLPTAAADALEVARRAARERIAGSYAGSASPTNEPVGPART